MPFFTFDLGHSLSAFASHNLPASWSKRPLLPLCLALATVLFSPVATSIAQAPASAPANSSQRGTVKEVTPNKLKIATDAGLSISVDVVEGAHVLQLPAGSTDLKSAQSITLGDIEIGDRVLVTGHADAPDAFTAGRVILMKSSDIAQKHAAEQEDWQKRGMGGLVNAIDPATGTLTVAAGAKKFSVVTSPATVYRRYAPGSIKFEDAQLSSLNQIQVGDQLRVRGAKAEDGTSIQAEEVVSGSFRNLAGTIGTIDKTAGTFTLKDLASKKSYTVSVTASSEVRTLPAEAAARLAARAKGAQAGWKPGAAGQTQQPNHSASDSPAPHTGAGGAGMDLSQMFTRLPEASLGDLKPGDAVMLVASQQKPGSDVLTAVTLLSGVEPILAATPSGSPTMTLSPWNVGGVPDGGGI